MRVLVHDLLLHLGRKMQGVIMGPGCVQSPESPVRGRETRTEDDGGGGACAFVLGLSSACTEKLGAAAIPLSMPPHGLHQLIT